MKNGEIGFGLVGTGMAGGFHAKELKHVRGGRLIAVCSRDPGRLQAFAREWEAPKSYTHFSELCRDPDVDVVCVLTPTGTHLEVARAPRRRASTSSSRSRSTSIWSAPTR